MELATDLEKQGSSNSSNSTVEVKMDNIGKKTSVKRDPFCLQITSTCIYQLYPIAGNCNKQIDMKEVKGYDTPSVCYGRYCFGSASYKGSEIIDK